MKIAVACMGEEVSMHFGHSEVFRVFEGTKDSFQETKIIHSPGHGKGSLPQLLIKEEVGVLITGGLGEGAMQKLEAGGIEVIRGAEGPPAVAVNEYLLGTLQSRGEACKGHHDHSHDHGTEKQGCHGQSGCR